MKLTKTQRLTNGEAERRAYQALGRHPRMASEIADEIWPGHSMTAQGAGAAAARILVRLKKAGRAQWHTDGTNWGWVRVTQNAAISRERSESA